MELPETVTSMLQSNKLSETHCIHICKLLNKKELIKRFETLYDHPQNKWTPEQIERFEQELKRRQDLQISLGKRITRVHWYKTPICLYTRWYNLK